MSRVVGLFGCKNERFLRTDLESTSILERVKDNRVTLPANDKAHKLSIPESRYRTCNKAAFQMVKKSRKKQQDTRTSLILLCSIFLVGYGVSGIVQGRSVPWGYQQKAGIAMLALGLVLQISVLRSKLKE
jgi:hypothetical protein